MTDDADSKTLGTYVGPTSAAPYPLSRMAPAFSLVDVAAEIQRADTTPSSIACAAISRSACGVYHLYVEPDGTRWFSLIAPREWSNPSARIFEGSFRLEVDMSFTRVDLDEP